LIIICYDLLHRRDKKTSSFKDIKKIRKELKEEGFDKDDIEIVLKLTKRISYLDKRIFPDNPAEFCFVRKNPEEFFAGFIKPRKNSKKRTYNIYIIGLAKMLRKEKSIGWVLIREQKTRWRSRIIKYTWEVLLLSIAAHEVRHRIQHDLSIKKLSPNDTDLVDDKFLGAIISFNETYFSECRIGKSVKYINERLNPKEFDAKVIGRLVQHKVHKNSLKSSQDWSRLLKDIVSVLKIQAPS
tara:strand:+ start:238 stop:957 length:720 start_codon:yes stop_codon:yes gene_type:complete